MAPLPRGPTISTNTASTTPTATTITTRPPEGLRCIHSSEKKRNIGRVLDIIGDDIVPLFREYRRARAIGVLGTGSSSGGSSSGSCLKHQTHECKLCDGYYYGEMKIESKAEGKEGKEGDWRDGSKKSR